VEECSVVDELLRFIARLLDGGSPLRGEARRFRAAMLVGLFFSECRVAQLEQVRRPSDRLAAHFHHQKIAAAKVFGRQHDCRGLVVVRNRVFVAAIEIVAFA
jgi:hypothetical protein